MAEEKQSEVFSVENELFRIFKEIHFLEQRDYKFEKLWKKRTNEFCQMSWRFKIQVDGHSC